MLLNYILESSSIYYGLTLKELRTLTYKVAIKNNLKVPQSWEDNKVVGEDWLMSFRNRFGDRLSLRQPEATSLNRMQLASNPTIVGDFFRNLETVMKKGFTLDRIWNADETGCSTVQTPQKQLAKKGEKRVGSMVSQEKGVTVTMCAAESATGNSIPPFLVFPRVNVQDHWKTTAPPGTECESHTKALVWMTSDNFKGFIKHFVKHARATQEYPVLLILDNHASHCSAEVIDLAKEPNITLLSFPSHCTHEMQPLHKTVYGPFQKFYDQAVKYGVHPWGLELFAESKDVYFNEQNKKGLHYLHKVELKNLHSETTYYFLPVSKKGSQSGPFYFKTPKSHSNWSPDFLMFGDLGILSDTVPSLVNEALSGEYTALFHVGDLAYDLKNQDGLVGDYFMKLIEPAAAAIPYLTCPGNHEIDTDTFTHYRHRFAMPDTEWPMPLDKMWYSIDIGPVHFVSYSTEVFFTNFATYVDDQKEWLIKDLNKANKNRQNVPWVIVLGHRPLYCSTHIGDDCSKPDSLVREGLEEIFYQMSVDIVVQGHEHNYERLWPVYRNQVTDYSYINPSAPVQLISGAAGSAENVDHFPQQKKPEWSAFRMDNKAMNSYGRMLVVNESHVLWEQRSIYNHRTLDSIWIVKNREGSGENGTQSSNPDDLSEEAKHLLSQVCKKSFLRCHPFEILVIVGSMVVLVIASLAVRFVVRKKRKGDFERAWARLPNEVDEDDIAFGDEEALVQS
ncbi:purple acid phosphatase [Elysia marginata]|uniref:Purple acid phosphatase n=1 Tax=Elysia marginata TaxID=1093978 RepID=A0AAV4I9Q1_9GAST|nr:purple acid phosphatase [Elysia marginata]